VTVPPRAVLFDAAGTLLRFREPVGETYRRFALDFGVDVPATRISEAFLRTISHAERMVFPAAPVERRPSLERAWWGRLVRATFRAADSTAIFDDFEAYFDRLWVHYAGKEAWELAPGTRAALEELRARGAPMGIVSNFDHRLPHILQALDIIHYFEQITIPSLAGAAKPDRLVFEVALQALEAREGVRPLSRPAVYVGDRAVEDVAGARQAGLVPIQVGSLATLEELPARIDALELDLQ
jgi:putative hydrolase of the HAD superfamily